MKDGWKLPLKKAEKIRAELIARQRNEKNRLRWKKKAAKPRARRAAARGLEARLELSRWAATVRAQFDFTCCACGDRDVPLHAHHIRPKARWPRLRLDLENGVALCERCHAEVHRLLAQDETLYFALMVELRGGAREEPAFPPTPPEKPRRRYKPAPAPAFTPEVVFRPRAMKSA